MQCSILENQTTGGGGKLLKKILDGKKLVFLICFHVNLISNLPVLNAIKILQDFRNIV